MKPIRFILASFLFLAAACGGSSSTDEPEVTPNITPTGTSSSGTKVNFNYQFTVATESNSMALDTSIVFPNSGGFNVPLSVQSNGIVSMKAADFPRMVLRVCRTGSASANCSYFYTPDETVLDAGDVDLVFDACSAATDAECGAKDASLFTGTLKADGTMNINSIAIRIRVFAVTDSLDGFSANATQGGLLSLPRMIVAITTDTVTTGSLSATGSKVAGKKVGFVGAGVIPSSMPYIGGLAFLSTITGSFDVDPLGLLAK